MYHEVYLRLLGLLPHKDDPKILGEYNVSMPATIVPEGYLMIGIYESKVKEAIPPKTPPPDISGHLSFCLRLKAHIVNS